MIYKSDEGYYSGCKVIGCYGEILEITSSFEDDVPYSLEQAKDSDYPIYIEINDIGNISTIRINKDNAKEIVDALTSMIEYLKSEN